MKKILRRTLAIVSVLFSNNPSQNFLMFLSSCIGFLQGSGTGSWAHCSGENSIFRKVLEGKRRGDKICIFDVGSNKGQFLSLALSNLQKSECELDLHCFEPSEGAFKILKENYGGISGVAVNNCGLGDNAGVMSLYYDSNGSGLASLTKRDLSHIDNAFGLSEMVRIEKLDEYCQKNTIEKIDLLKIDVEGHELDVLKGAKKTIDGGRVSKISFEFGGCNIDTRTYFRDFFKYFSDCGYDIYKITPSGYHFKISSYSERLEIFRTTNFLAVRR